MQEQFVWRVFIRIYALKRQFIQFFKREWRKRRDSNPRDGFPPTPLAGERLRPLGHVSADPYIDQRSEKQELFSILFGQIIRA